MRYILKSRNFMLYGNFFLGYPFTSEFRLSDKLSLSIRTRKEIK